MPSFIVVVRATVLREYNVTADDESSAKDEFRKGYCCHIDTLDEAVESVTADE